MNTTRCINIVYPYFHCNRFCIALHKFPKSFRLLLKQTALKFIKSDAHIPCVQWLPIAVHSAAHEFNKARLRDNYCMSVNACKLLLVRYVVTHFVNDSKYVLSMHAQINGRPCYFMNSDMTITLTCTNSNGCSSFC